MMKWSCSSAHCEATTLVPACSTPLNLIHEPSPSLTQHFLSQNCPRPWTSFILAPRCADVGLAPPRVEKVAQLMAMCDTDKSGLLDLAEFDKFFQIVLRDAAKRANKLGRMDSEKKLASVK